MVTLFLTWTEDVQHIKGLADTWKYLWTQGTSMHLNTAMQSRIHTHSTISPLSSAVSVSFLISACFLTVLVPLFDIHKCITVLCNVPRPQGRLHLPVSPERRENSRFLSTAQQPSSPLGNNSAASLLVRTPLCHANCFVFLTLSLFPSILSEQKAVWKEKKGLFSPFQNSAFETVWAHADRGNATSLWIYDYRVKALGFPTVDRV